MASILTIGTLATFTQWPVYWPLGSKGISNEIFTQKTFRLVIKCLEKVMRGIEQKAALYYLKIIWMFCDLLSTPATYRCLAKYQLISIEKHFLNHLFLQKYYFGVLFLNMPVANSCCCFVSSLLSCCFLVVFVVFWTFTFQTNT